ncbi:FAD-binding protein [Paraburkholderia sp. NMBU_R16]|uniref:D-2-hydroxyglutarate dehydrogenase YdiJ n=1 Tax=Paraburkholderia sp. NMBU_R16 TaxID=2698676 RepID=UPI001565F75D|nr:FAD-binding and (Fe-S)-binding domain-containing protein [Paraburkholderia sp. NMBU_R16]NRO97233.1 FAD-binding protein [Paraburkholderia sp. NMBU_R16]
MIPRLDRLPEVGNLYLAFATELRMHGFEGDIRDGYADRTALATDNSIYQVVPRLAVFPRTQQDLVRIARLASNPRFHGVRLFPRGGGTGTNGQSLGEGVAVDLSRHMNRILEINVEERWARVQAGVVKDQLEAALEPHGLFFAPELSTSNRATIGGMINTDASGQGSCRYGKTRDHVLELVTVLTGGTVWTSAPIDDETLAGIRSREDLIGCVHRTVDDIQQCDAELIQRHFPKLNRSLTGYDLAHIRDSRGRFDLNSILCGSEGTLGFISEAKVGLLPIPKFTALIVVGYASFDAALRDAPRLLKVDAASIETIDSVVLGLAREDNTWPAIRRFFPDTTSPLEGVNLIEFAADEPETLETSLSAAFALLATANDARGMLGHSVARGHVEVGKVWEMRKRAVGLLGRLRGEARPIPFVEDTAVPAEHLADYIAEFRALLDRRGLTYGMFGHADAGVLHVRPVLDMKDPEQEGLVRSITDEVAALTRQYGGVLWGEHGKGLRSEYAPAFFGPLYGRLQQIKAAFDPNNQLNPGKIATPPGQALTRVDEVPTRGQRDRIIPVALRRTFADSLHCNGNGACFNFAPDDAMCPSWKALRERRFSPKGRASLLREWLYLISEAGYARHLDGREQGFVQRIASLPRRIRNTLAKRKGEYDFSHEVKEAMDTCLACKSCAGQCPVKVDVPAFRARFLAVYHTRYLRPARDWVLACLEPALPWMAKAPRWVNAVLASHMGQWGLRRIGLVGIPMLSGMDAVLEARRGGVAMATPETIAAAQAEGRQVVVVVQDAFTSHFEAGLVLDALRLLDKLGFHPLLAPLLPSGKPLHVHGFLDRFRRTAQRNARMLGRLAAAGVPLVGIDPAMTLVYRSEYREALGEAGAPRVHLLQEWLAEALGSATQRVADDAETYVLLAHCTERTNAASAIDDWKRVFTAFGARLNVPRAACCGMSGTYGHEARNRATSETIYGMSWAPAVARHRDRGRLMASGYSCRCQVRAIDAADLPHPLQVLLSLLDRKSSPVSSTSSISCLRATAADT